MRPKPPSWRLVIVLTYWMSSPPGRPGSTEFCSWWSEPDPETLAAAREAYTLARRVILAGEHDLVILDEVNLCLAYSLVPLAEMLEVLRQRPPYVEVVLTGRNAPPELVDLADLVTEMRLVKHYFEAGVKARRGIEW